MDAFTRSRFLRRVLPGFLTTSSILTLAACTKSDSTNQALTTNSVSADSASSNVLKVTTAPNYPPFSYIALDGSLQGFDISLINAVGEAANFLIQFKPVELFDDIIRGLYSREADAAIIAMTITPDRAKAVSFSRPYFKSGLVIAVKDSDTTITSPEALTNKQIGVETGTTGATKARSIPRAIVVGYDSAPIAFQELIAGNVDAVIGDAAATQDAIKKGYVKGVKTVGGLLTEEFYGIATPKGSPHLAIINQGLTKIMSNGTYRSLYQTWFGGEPPALPEQAPS
ncbi:MAG TPA: basic amino acid ABC transporter substrate-binding protein [Trichocoleus sp.]|jgi:arginine/lysine/histidine/glutamine transport system substrate-binding/permease protein